MGSRTEMFHWACHPVRPVVLFLSISTMARIEENVVLKPRANAAQVGWLPRPHAVMLAGSFCFALLHFPGASRLWGWSPGSLRWSVSADLAAYAIVATWFT